MFHRRHIEMKNMMYKKLSEPKIAVAVRTACRRTVLMRTMPEKRGVQNPIDCAREACDQSFF